MSAWLVFLCSFAYVALRALQQRNVQHDNFLAIPFVSLGMAFGDVVLVVNISKTGFHLPLVLTMAAGSALGCMAAMIFHKRFLMRRSHASD